jgi:hypothetical protein
VVVVVVEVVVDVGTVVVDVVDVVDVVGLVVDAVGNVMMSDPSPVESSVSEPVTAPGVLLFAPDLLATQR